MDMVTIYSQTKISIWTWTKIQTGQLTAIKLSIPIPSESREKSGNGINSSRYWTTCSKFGLASGTLSTDRDERGLSTQFVITSFEYVFLSPTLTIMGHSLESRLLFLCLEEDFILNIDFTKTSFPDGLCAFWILTVETRQSERDNFYSRNTFLNNTLIFSDD